MPRHHRTESKTSPRRLLALRKQGQALELLLAGANYTQIALQLGYFDRGGAYRAVQAAMVKTLQPAADEVRRNNLERLTRLRLANWPKAISGDMKAIETELHLQEREARYLGLDTQPTDEGAKAMALAAVQVVIQVGDKAVPLGEWRRALLSAGDGKGDGKD